MRRTRGRDIKRWIARNPTADDRRAFLSRAAAEQWSRYNPAFSQVYFGTTGGPPPMTEEELKGATFSARLDTTKDINLLRAVLMAQALEYFERVKSGSGFFCPTDHPDNSQYCLCGTCREMRERRGIRYGEPIPRD